MPLKEIMMKMTMQMVLVTLTRIDTELTGRNSWNHTENAKYLEYESHDFAHGYDRRLLMLTSNTILLNLPANVLNGSLLRKLIKSGKKV